MTQARPHPALSHHAEATVAICFAMPLSNGLRAFLAAHERSTPAMREALVLAVEGRFRAALAPGKAVA